MRISVCICTYRRPRQLAALLGDLCAQTRPPEEVVVVDNDDARSAQRAVEPYRTNAPFRLVYAVQPVKNIALARNRCVELARGDWIAFLDDDERSPPSWLETLAGAAGRYGAGGVLGPVQPALPADAPMWIRRGHFYDWARMPSGTLIPRNRLRFGNVLVQAQWLSAASASGDGIGAASGNGPFDPAYGLTGGEDGDLLCRLAAAGCKLVWCDEAAVHEPVEPARLSFGWLLRRALRGGQDFARHTLAGRYGPPGAVRTAALAGRSTLQMLAAAALALASLPFGLHNAAHWATRASANLGKLSFLWGWHYREYS